ncbi:MAG: hypothetical protein COX39_00475 [Candidatus Nealsonbacteria bacterium CG23_combo_of_CG06-09_8_20_14_all_40_13]|uniref:Uncharacterized protein n=1 Tax=Candidatus Nealsonbacteria bacterium CG23_combo_of_CG06-09_8_20_14_all_40_13 TaxID=1974724 RepID=A0A2G9YRL7_9BACT|nr:MAG: hypothetical protein COX39_00475 [Candidatus Nealsonbacteria bacterium CG23_combo_of_CG06-09_8_20_14_all_40_13]PIR70727.1 MAG: hypothetical protein COU44_03300 [Candidatus Nealsonbacteria bacterium CG10_big_fil_rev_8_21_14_0_10_40_24]PIU43215.1 MAG: hypothetical protein COS97_02100 [Candidatus Nealsonbacteria bacterium CG07_land_8_20_14_0_80_40_10]
MKKIFEFIRNPFWQDKAMLFILGASGVCLAVYWLLWAIKIKYNFTPFVLASAFFVLNIIVALWAFQKNKLISFLLLGTALLIQILTLVYLRYLFIYQSL